MSLLEDFQTSFKGIDEGAGVKEQFEVCTRFHQTRALCSIADSLRIIGQAYDLPKEIPDGFPVRFMDKGEEE